MLPGIDESALFEIVLRGDDMACPVMYCRHKRKRANHLICQKCFNIYGFALLDALKAKIVLMRAQVDQYVFYEDSFKMIFQRTLPKDYSEAIIATLDFRVRGGDENLAHRAHYRAWNIYQAEELIRFERHRAASAFVAYCMKLFCAGMDTEKALGYILRWRLPLSNEFFKSSGADNPYLKEDEIRQAFVCLSR